MKVFAVTWVAFKTRCSKLSESRVLTGTIPKDIHKFHLGIFFFLSLESGFFEILTALMMPYSFKFCDSNRLSLISMSYFYQYTRTLPLQNVCIHYSHVYLLKYFCTKAS